MAEVESALKELAEKHRAGLATVHAQVERLARANPKQYESARQLEALYTHEQWLIDKAEELGSGHPTALREIESVLRNRSTHAHARLLAAMLLAIIDTPSSLAMLYERIVDDAEPDILRFSCAIQLGAAESPAARPLTLKAINDPSTDEEFDDDAKLREKMLAEHLPINLRMVLISNLMDTPAGTAALTASVRSPGDFQYGWLFSIMALWQEEEESDSYILQAAAVLKNRSLPERLRIDAAQALYMMREQTRGRKLFPKPAWDALRAVWKERDWGKLRGVVAAVLKLQGVR
jgi:hypothetical protein